MASVGGTKKPVPGYTGEEHPEIVDIRAMPTQPKVLKPGQVPETMVRQYFEEGYILIEKFFEPEELNPCRDSISELVEELAQKLYKAGKIKDLHRNADIYHRLTEMEKEYPGASIVLHKTGKMPNSFMDVFAHERLLNLVEQLIGADIAGSPSWNLRCKTPQTEAGTVPWHQDLGYQSVDAYNTMIVTVWIPFLDANAKNGCMQLIPRGHLKGKCARHYSCAGDTWYVILPDEEIKDTLGVDVKSAKTFPVPYGGILVFSNFLPHRSLDNLSDQIRWSIDLRYKRSGSQNGMHGLKDDVKLRSSTTPNMIIDWSVFQSTDRHKRIVDKEGNIQDVERDELEPIISGPWIKKWELVHRNRHTDRAYTES